MQSLPEGAPDDAIRSTAGEEGARPRRDEPVLSWATEQAIHRLAASLGAVQGAEFFRSLVRELTQILGLDYAMVGELSPAGDEITSLAACGPAGLVPNFSYQVAGTPCQRALADGLASYPTGMTREFPDDPTFVELQVDAYVGVPLVASSGAPLGVLVTMHRRAVEDVPLVSSVLQVFAMRAAAELERTRADEALRASEERYRKFFEENLSAVCVVRPDGEITAANPAFAGTFGFLSVAEILEVNVRALVQDCGALEELFRRVCEEGSVRALETSVTRWDGRPLHLLGSLVAERRGGELREITCYWIDITERKLAEQQLLHAQRLESIGTLAGGMAHDLNNVLAPVLMSVDLLRDLVGGERGQRLLASVERSTRRGMDLVRQVLWFARGVEGERTVFDAGPLLGEVHKIVGESFPRNISVRTEVSEGLPAVLGDPTQVYQVLMNLALNARDAMPRGGSLRLGARLLDAEDAPAAPGGRGPAGLSVELSVADTGTGIEPEDQSRIFEPFFTTKPPGEGTGLGLSTAHSIVKSHGGVIFVESTPGAGSVFRVRLPVADASARLASPEVQRPVPRGRGELILVIDDEPTIRDVCRETLEVFGYTALTAADGAEGVASFARHNGEVAAVVTDLAMPIMDGPAAIRAIRRLNRSVPILAMSGLAERHGLREIEEHGLAAFLEKPFSAEELLTHLGEILEIPQPT